jgi:hypothetical protein
MPDKTVLLNRRDIGYIGEETRTGYQLVWPVKLPRESLSANSEFTMSNAPSFSTNEYRSALAPLNMTAVELSSYETALSEQCVEYLINSIRRESLNGPPESEGELCLCNDTAVHIVSKRKVLQSGDSSGMERCGERLVQLLPACQSKFLVVPDKVLVKLLREFAAGRPTNARVRRSKGGGLVTCRMTQRHVAVAQRNTFSSVDVFVFALRVYIQRQEKALQAGISVRAGGIWVQPATLVVYIIMSSFTPSQEEQSFPNDAASAAFSSFLNRMQDPKLQERAQSVMSDITSLLSKLSEDQKDSYIEYAKCLSDRAKGPRKGQMPGLAMPEEKTNPDTFLEELDAAKGDNDQLKVWEHWVGNTLPELTWNDISENIQMCLKRTDLVDETPQQRTAKYLANLGELYKSRGFDFWTQCHDHLRSGKDEVVQPVAYEFPGIVDHF